MSKTDRVEARFSAELKSLAERAALASGYTLTDYLAFLVREDAPKRLKLYNDIVLTNELFDSFISVCDKSPPPSQKLLSAARKLDQEGF